MEIQLDIVLNITLMTKVGRPRFSSDWMNVKKFMTIQS